jgi:phage terminase small subunit
MRGGLILTVEIMAGTSEADAARALVQLADRTGVQSGSKHNGVEMFADPGDTTEDVMRRFERERDLQNYPERWG